MVVHGPLKVFSEHRLKDEGKYDLFHLIPRRKLLGNLAVVGRTVVVALIHRPRHERRDVVSCLDTRDIQACPDNCADLLSIEPLAALPSSP